MHQFFSTIVQEAKITNVSKPYHELKFNHHDLYYNPLACIYLYQEKNNNWVTILPSPKIQSSWHLQ